MYLYRRILVMGIGSLLLERSAEGLRRPFFTFTFDDYLVSTWQFDAAPSQVCQCWVWCTGSILGEEYDLCLFGFWWFPLPLGVWEELRFVIVALPGLFFFFFFFPPMDGLASCMPFSLRLGFGI